MQKYDNPSSEHYGVKITRIRPYDRVEIEKIVRGLIVQRFGGTTISYDDPYLKFMVNFVSMLDNRHTPSYFYHNLAKLIEGLITADRNYDRDAVRSLAVVFDIEELLLKYYR